VGVNGTLPVYMVQSDFDYESVALGLHQEYIELDLFHYGLEVFSEQDFIDAGLTAADRNLIEYMSIQETGHATLLTNMLGQSAPKQCTYDYPFKTVREFIDFNVKLTRWGESGTWGFLSHLNSKEVATLLVQAEAIEARQQAAFRQMLGLHAMPIWFAPGIILPCSLIVEYANLQSGIPQSWHWTLLAPYITSCPANNTRLVWQNFPALHIKDQPNPNRYVKTEEFTVYELTSLASESTQTRLQLGKLLAIVLVIQAILLSLRMKAVFIQTKPDTTARLASLGTETSP
jgi:hypothetical protein